MVVTFISQCEKKALARTRRVLDAFANRIGDNTWQTVITQEGLKAVYKLLRKTASKNSAVSCHQIRSRSRIELIWVVGNKSKFDAHGLVPVNSTTVHQTGRDDQMDWHYLPLIQALASLAALLHDWGKANARFQEKLKPEYKGKQADALRHEWVSCLLLRALIDLSDQGQDISDQGRDKAWLDLLASGSFCESNLLKADGETVERPLHELPKTAQLVAWLIVTHHRLPLLDRKDRKSCSGVPTTTLNDALEHITNAWGYENKTETTTFRDCLQFPDPPLSQSVRWVKQLKRWSAKLLQLQPQIERVFSDNSYRIILHHARLCLMLGDHNYSSYSKEESGSWERKTGLIANTQNDGTGKQYLDQHLVGVYDCARNNAYRLPALERDLPGSTSIGNLKRLSPSPYRWQNTAVKVVRTWRTAQTRKQGFFAVNMASTGCGKTYANAKIMLALSEHNHELRYVLALGLRTLTLQTGDEYRRRIFKNDAETDLAVIIGSRAVAELHEQNSSDEEQTADEKSFGSESSQPLLPGGEEVSYSSDIPEDILRTVLRTERDQKFLYAPILVCTIDHMMAATETIRGGRYILPCLRLLSSDLVIDEIDDFSGADLIAIGRLIHLAGMLGRKVMISSATIPPALAEGYFNCYLAGWRQFQLTRSASTEVGCLWTDEFKSIVKNIDSREERAASEQYRTWHTKFVDDRISCLVEAPARRKANIVSCDSAMSLQGNETTKQSAYFNIIARQAVEMHKTHATTDEETGLRVSFGVVRMANIQPCVELTRYFLRCNSWPDNVTIRTMAYHSQQVLLLRHKQEKHLDLLLQRKESEDTTLSVFKNSVIRKHLDGIAAEQNDAKHTIFILVATPVEEVGRDHDFDWAIVEPSSYRSLVQLAGRVKRHREGETKESNVAILQYNWKTIRLGEASCKARFIHPGYEKSDDQKWCFKTHNLHDLLNVDEIEERLDATHRIRNQPPDAVMRFAKLEHHVIADQLTNYKECGPESLQGYLSNNWFITGLPQALNPFREGAPNTYLFRVVDSQGRVFFTERDERGLALRTEFNEPVEKDDFYAIKTVRLTEEEEHRLWLTRDYYKLLLAQAEHYEQSLLSIAMRFGELVYTKRVPTSSDLLYNDQLGMFKGDQRTFGG